MSKFDLSGETAGLIVIDLQEKLCAAMDRDQLARCARNVLVLLEAARQFEIPTLVSEQYPRGLGSTLPAVREALERIHPAPPTFEKVAFSCCGVPSFEKAVAHSHREKWILVGAECHVCVFQTARDLIARGCAVHVVADAVLSRSEMNWRLGLNLMSEMGAIVSNTETILFDLLKRAEGDHWKALSTLIK